MESLVSKLTPDQLKDLANLGKDAAFEVVKVLLTTWLEQLKVAALATVPLSDQQKVTHGNLQGQNVMLNMVLKFPQMAKQELERRAQEEEKRKK